MLQKCVIKLFDDFLVILMDQTSVSSISDTKPVHGVLTEDNFWTPVSLGFAYFSNNDLEYS